MVVSAASQVRGRTTDDGRSNRAVALRLLGLAHRAGKLQLGSGPVLRALRHEPPGIVVLARDSGGDLRRKVERAAGSSILDGSTFEADELAQALGRNRLAVVSVHDPGFVSGLAEYLANRGESS